jgi:two-component system KDP operon response regulator KdpE
MAKANPSIVAKPNPRILVIDDEMAIRRFLRTSLGAEGFDVFEAATGQQGLLDAASQLPDLILLDLGLPDLDGVEVTRRLREWSQAPIIIISVRDREAEKIRALDVGADDYLTKPFGLGELLARIRAAMRRTAEPDKEPVFTAGALVVDFGKRLVNLNGKELTLTPTEYGLLRVMASHQGRVLTHRQLLREVWGPAYEQDTHLLRVHMSNLRQKLEQDPARPAYIITEAGVGYRFRE